MNDFQNLVAQVRKLSLDEKRALNTILVDSMKHDIRVEAATRAKDFKLGDIVSFVCTKRGRQGVKYVKVTEFSRDRTKIKGYECDRTGTAQTQFPTQWTVGMSLISKVVA